MGSNPAAVRGIWKGCRPMVLVLFVLRFCISSLIPKVTLSLFRCAFCMAWARILLLFEEFASSGLGDLGDSAFCMHVVLFVLRFCISSLTASKGNVRHFFGVLFGWHGLESCCCSRDLEGVSSNGFGAVRIAIFISSLMDSKGNVRHFFGVLFACNGFQR